MAGQHVVPRAVYGAQAVGQNCSRCDGAAAADDVGEVCNAGLAGERINGCRALLGELDLLENEVQIELGDSEVVLGRWWP